MRIRAEGREAMELQALGDRIVQRRACLGVSRRDLARAAGIGEEHLRKIEGRLRANISATTIVRLCKALNMNADMLLGLEKEP
jgi:transcriptional regulator with XRE-family HTH domain